jgi:pimeloyl-ACP methyl ester carboxylesterase
MSLLYLACLLLLSVALKLVSDHQRSSCKDQLDFRYKTYGDVAGRETVVLIPGLDGVTPFFADVIPQLTVNYNVVMFYIPLYTRNMSSANSYNFEFFAQELHTIVHEDLQLNKVTIVGESFGGIIAQYYVYMYPKFATRLVLLSSLAKAELPPEVQFKLDYLLPAVAFFGQYFPITAQQLFAVIHADDVVEPTEPAYVRSLFVKEASDAHFYSVLERVRLASTVDILHRVPNLLLPVLVIYGEQDHFTKAASLKLYDLLPALSDEQGGKSGSTSSSSDAEHQHQHQLRSLPGGHLAHVSAPKAFACLIKRFIGNSNHGTDEVEESAPDSC